MNYYWYINQAGIILEIIGALLIVVSAFKTRNMIKDIKNTYDADLPVTLRDVISEQAFTERKGFGLLAFGLVLQFIGGFN